MQTNRTAEYRWVMVGVLWLVHALAYLNISSLGILAPFIKGEFHLSSFQVGFLISAMSIGSSLGQMPAGLLSDFAGVRRMLTLAVGAIGGFFVLLSLAPSYGTALLIILFYGMANGIITPSASKSVIDWFPVIGRATAMGVKQTGVNFGGIFAGLLLPALAIALSWRQSLLAVGLAELVFAVLVFILAREAPHRPDVSPAPLDWRKILRMAMHRDMVILGGIAFCFMVSQFCFSTYLTLFLTQEMDYPIVRAGQWFAISLLFGAAGRILWSLASDYFFAGRRKGLLALIAGILLLSSLTLGLIPFFPAAVPLLTVAMLAFGVSGVGWNAIYNTLLGEAVDMESTALATGVGYFYGFMGSLIGPPLFGLVADATGSYGYAWFLPAFCGGAFWSS